MKHTPDPQWYKKIWTLDIHQFMDVRRNMFVTLLTSRFRTMDHMMAFSKSVNLILNIRNIDDFDKIIQRALADYGLFYKVFKESLTP